MLIFKHKIFKADSILEVSAEVVEGSFFNSIRVNQHRANQLSLIKSFINIKMLVQSCRFVILHEIFILWEHGLNHVEVYQSEDIHNDKVVQLLCECVMSKI